MARARNIKPSLFKNEELGTNDLGLMVLFEGLWCLADREGRLEDRPLRIKAEIFPYRDANNLNGENTSVNGYLTELARLGFIDRYEVDGVAIIQILKFAKHQRPHHTEKPSELPEKPEESTSQKITVKQPLKDGENPSRSALIPDSLNTDSGFPNIAEPDGSAMKTPPAASQPKKPKRTKPPAKTTEVWESYSAAFEKRYGVKPERPARVNGQLSKIIDEAGAKRAPRLAAYFLTRNDDWITARRHSVGTLLKGIDGLLTDFSIHGERELPDDFRQLTPEIEKLLIGIYHKKLPGLPRVVSEMWEDSEARSLLSSQWHRGVEFQTSDFWNSFFESAASNPWWDQNLNAKKPDLRWLLQTENFARVLSEGGFADVA